MRLGNDEPLQRLFAEYKYLPDFYVDIISVHQRGLCGDTLLHIAIHRRREEEVRVLLDAGADPNAGGDLGYRPLHVAVISGQDEITRILLRAGARLDLKDDEGRDIWECAKTMKFDGQLSEIVREICGPVGEGD